MCCLLRFNDSNIPNKKRNAYGKTIIFSESRKCNTNFVYNFYHDFHSRIFFEKLKLTSIKPSSNQMGVNLQIYKKLSVIPLFSVSNEAIRSRSMDQKLVNLLYNNHALMFFLSHLGSYVVIWLLSRPVMDCPSIVDYILERNLMKCQ